MNLDASLDFIIYSAWNPSACDDVSHICGESSILVEGF